MKKNSFALGALIRLILGLLLLLFGLWLWTKTLGTQLLFTDVTIGRISRFWFIPVVIGLILLMTVAYSVVRKPKPKNERMEEQVLTEGETANAEPQPQSMAGADGAEEEQISAEMETANAEPQSQSSVSDGIEEQVPEEAEPVMKESQPSAEAETAANEPPQPQAEQENVDTGQQFLAGEETH